MSKKLPKRGRRCFKMETVLQQAISAIAETTPVDQQSPKKKRSRKQTSKSRINQNSSRQSKLREYDRRFREKRKQTETPEEAEARRAKAREAARIRRQQANKIALVQQFKGLLEQATGKQIEESSETANNEQNKIHQARLEKQKEDRRLKSREYNRLARQRLRECETPEQAAARRAKTAAATKLRWQRAREALLAHIPALQMIQKPTMDTISDENSGVQNAIRQGLKPYGTPEVDQTKAAQILRQQATGIQFQERRKATETPIKATTRRAKVNERARKKKQKAIEKELELTAKQNALSGGGASQRSWKKLAKYFLNASEIQNATQETVTKAIACKQEFDANSLGCSTSTLSSECSFSIKTESDAYPPAQQNPNEVLTVKSEYSEDSWSCYHGSESSFLTHDNKGFESTTNFEGSPRADIVPDEHSTYGEYIADRFYNANRNKSEDNVAQMLIESIMLNLLSGVYGYSINYVEADEEEEAPSLPTPLTNNPIVVVKKEEVDL